MTGGRRTVRGRVLLLLAAALATATGAGAAAAPPGEVLPPRWRLDAGFMSDNYTNFRRAERSSYAQGGHSFGQTEAAWLRWEWLNHFSSVDTVLQAGGTARLAEHIHLTGALGATPHAGFRPNTQADLGAEFPGLGAVAPLAGYRGLFYRNGSVHVFTPGLRWQASPLLGVEGRYSLSVNLDDSTTGVVSLRLDSELGRLLPYAGLAHGEEALPPQRTATITYYSAGAVLTLTPAYSVRLDYGHEDRRGFYARNSIGGGVTVKF